MEMQNISSGDQASVMWPNQEWVVREQDSVIATLPPHSVQAAGLGLFGWRKAAHRIPQNASGPDARVAVSDLIKTMTTGCVFLVMSLVTASAG